MENKQKETTWAPAVKQSMAYKAGFSKYPYRLKCDFKGDGLGTRGKSLKFMFDPAFESAWTDTVANYREITGEDSPDIRWRAHVVVWAARHGLSLEGDFVDCGVWTGVLAQMVCRLTDFSKSGKKYWLFDTWSGVPVERLVGSDLELANMHNKLTYHRHNPYEAVKKNFSQWPTSRLVQGILPESLSEAKIEKIAYLSVDLNNTIAEQGCIEALWPKMASNAFIVLDDYGWTAHRPQQNMWDDFAASKGKMIVTLPTGQGLLIKD